jgi:outer membrane protein OmpA-like peptidoglycan-associated protein
VSKSGYVFFSENYALKENTSFNEPFSVEVLLQTIPVAVVENTPAAKPEPTKTVILKNIFFDFGSANLHLSSESELKQLIALLNENPTVSIQINGHTDNVGSEANNLALSQSRAEAVMDYLIQKGISANRLTAKGFGESQPIDTNDTEAGRKRNRRTEFIVTKQ